MCSAFLEDGVDVENVLELFSQGEEMLGVADFGLQFIFENANDVLTSPSFAKLDERRVIRLISDSKLPVDEISVVKAVTSWGRARIGTASNDEEKRNGTLFFGWLVTSLPPASATATYRYLSAHAGQMREVVKNLLPHIRFPLLTAVELGTVVAPSGLLDQAMLMNLFKYAHASPSDRLSIDFPFPNSIASFGDFFRWCFSAHVWLPPI